MVNNKEHSIDESTVDWVNLEGEYIHSFRNQRNYRKKLGYDTSDRRLGGIRLAPKLKKAFELIDNGIIIHNDSLMIRIRCILY